MSRRRPSAFSSGGAQAAFLSAGGYHHHLGLNTWESRSGQAPTGHTGLYHTAFLYPDRAQLADALRCAKGAGIAIDGPADHGVSEAIYRSDPDRNGVGPYRGRPADERPRDADGNLAMVNDPFDLGRLLSEAPR